MTNANQTETMRAARTDKRITVSMDAAEYKVIEELETVLRTDSTSDAIRQIIRAQNKATIPQSGPRKPGSHAVTEDTLKALRGDYDKLAGRVKQLEAEQRMVAEQRVALERQFRAGFEEMRGAFRGIGARFDGLESELRYRFEQTDARFDDLTARLERIEGMLRRAVSNGEL
jgi:hypothetical protein